MQHLDKEGQGARHAHLHHHNTTTNTKQHHTTTNTCALDRTHPRRGVDARAYSITQRDMEPGGKEGRGRCSSHATVHGSTSTFMYAGLDLLGSKPAQRVLPNLHTPHTHSRTLNIVRASARLMLCMAMR